MTMDTTTSAARRWQEELPRWAIPEHILREAPADPHHFSVARFSALATEALRQPPTPTHERARERLPEGGTVLDVGCGGGAGSLPLAPPAALLVGVDQSAGMLDAFAAGGRERGVAVRTVEGSWPQVAGAVPVADVVVCLHVVYNVADLAPFVQALTAHARARAVLEFTTQHPLAWQAPYWRRIHNVDRPTGPTGDDALALLTELGLSPHHERWARTYSLQDTPADDRIAFLRERLALGAERDDELRDLVRELGIPQHRDVITAWWDV
jgi:SAM-dependent methyltransferase